MGEGGIMDRAHGLRYTLQLLLFVKLSDLF